MQFISCLLVIISVEIQLMSSVYRFNCLRRQTKTGCIVRVRLASRPGTALEVSRKHANALVGYGPTAKARWTVLAGSQILAFSRTADYA